MTSVIHIDPEPLLEVIDRRGWTQGAWGDPAGDDPVCLHGAIRVCCPVPGDDKLIEQVAARQGWGTRWNDDKGTVEEMVRARLARGVDITDEDLATTFGPQWRAVVAVVRRAAALTPDEASRLAAARSDIRAAAEAAARVAAGNAARDAAWVAAWNAAGNAAWAAARAAARDAAWVAAWNAAWNAARDAAWDAAWVAVTWDLASPDGPYTFAHRDLLIGSSWVEVCGLPEGLMDAAAFLEEGPDEPR